MVRDRILRCTTCNFLASYPEDAVKLFSTCPICGHEDTDKEQSWAIRLGGNPVGHLVISREKRV